MTRGQLEMDPAAPAGPQPWARWVLVPAALGGLLFTTGLVVRLRCVQRRCPTREVRHLFDLEALGSLPRLFTTLLFLGVAVLAVLAVVRSTGRAACWWSMVATGGVLLCVAKAMSAHSMFERADGGWVTLVASVVLTVVGLSVLWGLGRRWGVPGATPVCLALAAYALAALGLDQVTAAVEVLTRSRALRAFAVFLEEGGEALTVLLMWAVIGRWMPERRSRHVS